MMVTPGGQRVKTINSTPHWLRGIRESSVPCSKPAKMVKYIQKIEVRTARTDLFLNAFSDYQY